MTSMLAPSRTNAETDEELRHFVEELAAEFMREGMSRDDALRRARIETGSVTVVREKVRASGWEHGIDMFQRDVRLAFRRLRRDTLFTIVSVFTLALGIGAATTIFSAVNPILFRALPYPEANRIVTVSERSADGSQLEPTFGTDGNSPQSFVISESLARRIYGNTDPIGQRARFGPDIGDSSSWGTIVDIAGDVKQESLASQNTDAFYVTNAQWRWVDRVQSLVVRTNDNAAAKASAVKEAVWSVDRNKPIIRIATIEVGSVAWLACLIPARRAAAIDPAIALRAE